MSRNTIKLIMTTLFFIFTVSCNSSDSTSPSTSSGDDGGSSSEWTFTADNVEIGIPAVSPEAILLTDGSVRLYVTVIGGPKLYRASDGLTFSEESGSFPSGSDPTLIILDNGTYRMYYVDINDEGVHEVWTATSPDGLDWIRESGTGITNTSGSGAWGVPDSVKLPDDRIRIYWVDMPPEDDDDEDVFEVIKSAISNNGTDFTEESGFRTEDGYVDPHILKAEDGDWIGLFSTTPDESRLPSKIYVGISSDGLTWTIESDPIITESGGNALDPASVQLEDGSYRVYYIATPGSDSSVGHFVKSGILRQNTLLAMDQTGTTLNS